MDEKKENEGPTFIDHMGEPARMASIDPDAPTIFADDMKCMIDFVSGIGTLVFFEQKINVKQEGRDTINLERVDLMGTLQVKIPLNSLFGTALFLQGLFKDTEKDDFNPRMVHFGPTYIRPKEE